MWEQATCPLIDDWVKKTWFITMRRHLARKKEILPFATTWMDLEGIILSEENENE